MKKSLLLCSSILALSAGSMSVMAQDRGGPEGGGGAGPSAASPGPSSGGGAADRGPAGGATSGGSMGDSKSMDGGADGASGSKMDSGDSGSSGSSAKSDMKDGAGDAAGKSQAQDRGKPGSDNAKSEMRDDKGEGKSKADADDKAGGKDKARADDKKRFRRQSGCNRQIGRCNGCRVWSEAFQRSADESAERFPRSQGQGGQEPERQHQYRHNDSAERDVVCGARRGDRDRAGISALQILCLRRRDRNSRSGYV